MQLRDAARSPGDIIKNMDSPNLWLFCEGAVLDGLGALALASGFAEGHSDVQGAGIVFSGLGLVMGAVSFFKAAHSMDAPEQ